MENDNVKVEGFASLSSGRQTKHGNEDVNENDNGNENIDLTCFFATLKELLVNLLTCLLVNLSTRQLNKLNPVRFVGILQ